MTKDTRANSGKPSFLLQLFVNFIIPIFILTRFSAESELGATKAFLLALAFPVGFEIYSIWRRRKVSMVSLAVIGGLLVTGAIGLFNLDENWLAIRRSVPYVFIVVVILVGQLIKRPVVNALLKRIFDMNVVSEAAREKGTLKKVEQTATNAAYALCGIFAAIAVASYILTHIIIQSPTGSDAFNQEYAHLRLVSLPAIALPLMVGIVVVISYLLLRIEKLTGLKSDDIMKQK